MWLCGQLKILKLVNVEIRQYVDLIDVGVSIGGLMLILIYFNKSMIESGQHRQVEITINNCKMHNLPLTYICKSPECNNYKQLCEACLSKQLPPHQSFHVNLKDAVKKTMNTIDSLQVGLKALNKKIVQQMETSLSRNQGLDEVQQKLNNIKLLINERIDNYKNQLKKIYEKEVKQKLHQLFEIVEKSRQFLEEEKIKLMNTGNVKPFFINDLNYQLTYYNSYYFEILEKNTRKFKSRFDDDKILKLTVNFQQHLEQIFTPEKHQTFHQKKLHAFYGIPSKQKSFHLFNGNELISQLLEKKQKKDDETWEGVVPSAYYPKKQCFYIFGQGSKESNKIYKYYNGELKQMGALNTKRKNFAVCLVDQQIYIVGGQNLKEGCLVKCQKYVPSNNKVYIINSLNQRSAKHNLVSYKDKFILKFGGNDLIEKMETKDNQINLYPQIYEIESEEWRKIDLESQSSNKAKMIYQMGNWPGIFKSEEDSIFIISRSAKNEDRQRYQLTFQYDTKEIKQIKIKTNRIKFQPNLRIISSISTNLNQYYYLIYDHTNKEFPIQLRLIN